MSCGTCVVNIAPRLDSTSIIARKLASSANGTVAINLCVEYVRQTLKQFYEFIKPLGSQQLPHFAHVLRIWAYKFHRFHIVPVYLIEFNLINQQWMELQQLRQHMSDIKKSLMQQAIMTNRGARTCNCLEMWSTNDTVVLIAFIICQIRNHYHMVPASLNVQILKYP